MLKGTENEKKYCEFLKKEFAEINSRHDENRKEVLEYYGGMSDSCEMELDNFDGERRAAINNLIAMAVDRGVSPENLEEIFGDDYFSEEPATSLEGDGVSRQ